MSYLKRNSIVALFCCALVALGLAFVPSDASAAAKKLKYTDHDPTGGLRTDFYKNVFFAEITKQTNGRIEIQDFWGGAMFSSSEALQGVADGVADLGLIFPDFTPKQLILHQVYKMFPDGPAKYENIIKFYQDIYTEIPEFSKEIQKFNQTPILMTPGLPASFCSPKPLNSLDDIKGAKWRASSRWHLLFLKAGGAVPTAMPWGETYMSLQTGALDGSMANYDGVHMTKQDEAAPNVLVSRGLWWGTPFIVTVNNDVWEGLSEEDRQGILKAAEIASAKYADAYNGAIDQIFDAQVKAGMKVRYLEQSEVDKWVEICKSANAPEIWLKDLKDMKVQNAEAIVEKILALHRKAVDSDKAGQ